MDTLYNKEERLENKKVINLAYPILLSYRRKYGKELKEQDFQRILLGHIVTNLGHIVTEIGNQYFTSRVGTHSESLYICF